jgi:hypothetical protein
MFNLAHDNPIIIRVFGAFFLAVGLLTLVSTLIG